jgi:DNA helicase-2/ATP-dependent DNA helicase PcrA
MPWNDNLNPATPAFAIAASAHSRIRIVAGPGTGKSFAMKRRVARLIEVDGVAANRILAVTFTRVAAEDLHRELTSLAVPNAGALQGRTLHSLSMSMLMRNHVLPTLGRTPRPLNVFEQEPLLADLNPIHGDKRARRKMIAAYVAGWARLQSEQPGYAVIPADQAFAHDLVEWMKLHHAMHIGEVIPQLYLYLRANPNAPERNEFAHIVVDEYQDLNRAEQEVVSLLGAAGHMCVVGDDDQSIYSFKHAHPAGILEWAQANAAQDHQVIECQRCPTRIVQMANALISHNQGRLPRAMVEKVANGPGEIEIRQYSTNQDEANAVAAKIVSLVGNGVPAGDIIVLAQRATFGTPIFNKLRTAGVPVKSYYAEADLDSEEAQERFAILKLFLNNEDRVALRWLLGCKRQDWFSKPYARVLQHIRQSGQSPWQTLDQLRSGALTIPHTAGLVARFNEICSEIQTLGASQDVDGFVAAWLPAQPETVLLAERTAICKDGCTTVAELYEKLYTAITQPEVPLEVSEVRVMSLHKSKGLSSPYVFVVGCVEGLVPAQPDPTASHLEQVAKLEEDRRLFYVAITRTKAAPGLGRPGYLAITYPQTMTTAAALGSQITPVATHHGTAYLQPSRFIQELGLAAPAPVGNQPL